MPGRAAGGCPGGKNDSAETCSPRQSRSIVMSAASANRVYLPQYACREATISFSLMQNVNALRFTLPDTLERKLQMRRELAIDVLCMRNADNVAKITL